MDEPLRSEATRSASRGGFAALATDIARRTSPRPGESDQQDKDKLAPGIRAALLVGGRCASHPGNDPLVAGVARNRPKQNRDNRHDLEDGPGHVTTATAHAQRDRDAGHKGCGEGQGAGRQRPEGGRQCLFAAYSEALEAKRQQTRVPAPQSVAWGAEFVDTYFDKLADEAVSKEASE